MKRKFSTPKLTAFGSLVGITQEFDDEAREFEEQFEEVDDDFESAAVIAPELDDG
ncbi:hypothetical protein [Acaryochloris marina]|uniref:Uncharacterized protein n=1 Tax=Acaryochloris marina (strain MBIC 11017) TaxID=329726 RepID=B0CA07_ACAM1|nr:hypothetical protein [Acaryochloris marina]ABW25447.1 hypothetical protein AM1_0390 [Acaryochloris marina MBIC11017]